MTRSLAALALAFALPAAVPAQADQLARSLDMPEGVYTTSELTLMREARQDHEPLIERSVIARATPDGERVMPFNWNPGVERVEPPRTPGAGELAAAMGLDPADHTTAELAAMFIDAHD